MSFIDLQKRRIGDLQEELFNLLGESTVVYSSTEGFINVLGDHTIIIGETEESIKLHSKLFKELNKIEDILMLMIDSESDEVKRVVSNRLDYSRSILEKKHIYTWDKTIEEIKKKLTGDWEKIIQVLSGIYTGEADEIIIPDTSYLLNNSKFEDMNSESGKELVIVVPTIVLQELDTIKEFHKNSDIQKTARSLIKRLKHVLANNIDSERKVVVKNKVYLIIEALEPKGSHLNEYLDMSVPDDRFIASAFDIIIRYSNSDCYVASDDFNQINKAIYFGIPVKGF